jgi:hypothetical protein|eukprot:COSAG02_NODE_3687_length_6383_cov_2.044558_2_plen_108_part_00
MSVQAQPSMALMSTLPQTSSPAIASPQSITSGTTSELDGRDAYEGEETDYRRVLGEGSVVEVELIRVDPDDLEGPLGVEGRSGVSGMDTPQSARSSFVRTHGQQYQL